MGSQRRSRQLSRIIAVGLVTLMGLLPSCTLTPTAPPTPNPSPPPRASFAKPPQTLCQAATQIRLRPQITGQWPGDASAGWELAAEDADGALNQGKWSPASGELFVAFPEGKALPPGAYRVTLRLNDEVLTRQTFTITAVPLELTSLKLALTPAGPDVAGLSEGTRQFYLRYGYQGACPGAPLWVTVRRGEEAVCTLNSTLNAESGADAAPCYRQDGAPLENGSYRAEITLMGEAPRRLDFEVGEQTAPTPTPTPAIPKCDPLFIAAGLTSEGEPFLPKDSFEWYTQAVYAGCHCANLPPEAPWETRWYRDGKLVREAGGSWTGAPEGVVWDSVTGVPAAPFLPPGTYTVTLEITDAPPITGTFRLVPYVRP